MLAAEEIEELSLLNVIDHGGLLYYRPSPGNIGAERYKTATMKRVLALDDGLCYRARERSLSGFARMKRLRIRRAPMSKLNTPSGLPSM